MDCSTMQTAAPPTTGGYTHRAVGGRKNQSHSRAVPQQPGSDKDLVDRILAGDPAAFSDVYVRYRQNVHRFILARVKDPSEAEDLTQETFVEAFRSIGGFEGRSRLLTWLLGIARYRCMRFYRFASRWMIGPHAVGSVDDQGFEPRIESRVDAILELDRCSDLLSRFRSPGAQFIFHLRYDTGLSIRDIAKVVDKSADSVKADLRRSRKLLEKNRVSSERLAA